MNNTRRQELRGKLITGAMDCFGYSESDFDNMDWLDIQRYLTDDQLDTIREYDA